MTQTSPCQVAVMLSIGKHPVSNRPRISPAERRAIGVALAAQHGPVVGVHSGRLDADMVYSFYGHGLTAVHGVDPGLATDPMPALLEWWTRHRPAIVVFGTQAEQGEGSGTLPYFFAQALGLPLVNGVVSMAVSGDRFEITQALSASSRRAAMVASPFVAIASPRAALPLGFSHAAAQWGRAESVPVANAAQASHWQPVSVDASAIRPRSLRSDMGLSLDQRLSGLVGGSGAVRQQYLDATPDKGAQVIVDALEGLGLLHSLALPAPDAEIQSK